MSFPSHDRTVDTLRTLIPGILCLGLLAGNALAETLQLGNDPWPPFLLEGEQRGTAEQIVCQALERAGHGCEVTLGDWETTLAAAEAGDIDGIAALWFTPERGQALHFSSAYLTNRLVPVTAADGPEIRGLEALAGKRVALEVAAAYGEALQAQRASFTEVPVRGVEDALRAVRDGQAEVALVDELIARDFIDSEGAGLVAGDVALSFRELHFAMSRQHPAAERIVADFNAAYQAMLRDGTVNRILDLEWLATDLESDGVMDFIHRGGGLEAAVAGVAQQETVYAVGQEDFDAIHDPAFVGSNARFLSDDTAYETPEAAMKALDSGRRCAYDSATARIVCSGR